MVRRAIGAVVILSLLAIVVLWRLNHGAEVPAAAAQTPAPGVPVTAGTVAAQDVPVFLRGIGTIQAYNMVAVKSRVDGQIVKVDFKDGQDIKAGDPIFQIDPRPFQAAPEQAQAAKQKDKAQLAVYAYRGDGKKQLAEGKLTLIDNAIDQATGTIRLKARFENENERLWLGEFVSLRVVLSTRQNVATVPSQTVQDGPDGHYAYVIKPDNTVERRAVEVASIQDGIAVVTKGLAAGERVVVDGQYRLTNGARVNPAAPAAPAGTAG